jgi:histidine ammonia-lyase
LKIVENAEKVLAIELMSCCQALDLRNKKVSPFLREIHGRVRKVVPYLKVDDIMSDHIKNLSDFIRDHGCFEKI